MTTQIKFLKQDEFYFRIILLKDSEYYGLDGVLDLVDKLPNNIVPESIKIGKPACKIYCLATSHSDYIGLESRLKIRTELI